MDIPKIEMHDRFFVVRDDLVPGGTKARVVNLFFEGFQEVVYASPVYGHAQIALARAARTLGKKATIFCAKRKVRHRCTEEAESLGAKIVEVPHGYLNVVQCRARQYIGVIKDGLWVDAEGAKLVPFGLECPQIIRAIAAVAKSTGAEPTEVWCAAGSGVLTRGLQLAWPAAKHYAVQVGAKPNAGAATVIQATEKYEQDAIFKPPFPSCGNYDAKVWQYIKQIAETGALFWNVAG